jgi:hypothetical protein
MLQNLRFHIRDVKTKYNEMKGSKHFNLIIISWGVKTFLFTLVAKYFNSVTFLDNLLCVATLGFCPALRWSDMYEVIPEEGKSTLSGRGLHPKQKATMSRPDY